MGDARPVSLQDVGKHAGDGRLAVGPGDDDGSLRQPSGDLVEQPGIDALGDQPGAAVPPPRPRPRIAAPVALAAANAAISRASRGGELGAIGEDDGDHLEPLEDHQRDHRHDLRVALGRIWRCIADATDDQATGHPGRAQRWAVGRQHELPWLGSLSRSR